MSSARTPFFLDSRTCLFHQGEARARSLGRCLRPASGWNQPLPKLPVIILAHSSSLFSLLYPLRLFSLFSSATGMPTLLRQVIWRSNGDSDGGTRIDRADAVLDAVLDAARCRANAVPMPCPAFFLFPFAVPSISRPLALPPLTLSVALVLMVIGWWIAKNANPRTLSASLAVFVPAGIMFLAGLSGMGLGAARIVLTALATRVNALWG